MKYLLPLPLLVLFLAVLMLSKRRAPLASRRAYMQMEYPNMEINDWIDYCEGYITG